MKRAWILVLFFVVTASAQGSDGLGRRTESLHDCLQITITGKGLTGAISADSIMLSQAEKLECVVRPVRP